MSSRASGRKRHGQRKPSFLAVPTRSYTDGKDCSTLATDYGLKPDPWQADILDVWLGRDENDLYTATRCGLSVPRQNGKNAILEMRELYGICIIGEKILHTAHEVKTARKAFVRLASFFENERRYPELAAMVVQIRKTNGQEAIVLNNGGSIEFSARSKGAARGFTVDVVVFDEAQELTDEQMEAIMSTMSAAPTGNRQLIFTGTPPYPRCAGTVFGRIRAEAYGGDIDPNLAWHEWSVTEIGNVKDRKRWYATNPALGIRLDEEFTEKEVRTLSEDGFARERLGWWSSNIGTAIISSAEWEKLATCNPPSEGRMAVGVKFSPDGARASIAVAIKAPGGVPHVEVVDSRSMNGGVGWIASFMLDVKATSSVSVIDGRSWVDALTQELNEGGFPKRAICIAQTKDIIASSAMFMDAVRQSKITHFGQPALDDSVTHCQKRMIGNGGGYGFGPISDSDTTLIESCALALWGISTTRRDPTRKQRIL